MGTGTENRFEIRGKKAIPEKAIPNAPNSWNRFFWNWNRFRSENDDDVLTLNPKHWHWCPYNISRSCCVLMMTTLSAQYQGRAYDLIWQLWSSQCPLLACRAPQTPSFYLMMRPKSFIQHHHARVFLSSWEAQKSNNFATNYLFKLIIRALKAIPVS